MDAPLDRYRASREELIALVRRHREQIADLERKVERLHALTHCPHCRTAPRGGTIQRTRDVIEVVPAPVVVTAHVSLERHCPRGGGRWLPGAEWDGVVVGQGRLGVGLLRLIAVLREELRLPIGAIPWYLVVFGGGA